MGGKDWPDGLAKRGTILTKKQRELLVTGDIEEVEDSTIRRQKQEIRKRFAESLVDLSLMADKMSLDELESLMERVSKRESEENEAILSKGLSALVAMSWLTTNPTAVENAVSGGVFWGEQAQAIEMGYLADLQVGTFIQFFGGSAYHQFQELENVDLQNRRTLSPLEKEIAAEYTP